MEADWQCCPSRNLHFTREKTRQRAHVILKPWKRGGLEDFSRTKEDEMTAATFDHQVGKSLQSLRAAALISALARESTRALLPGYKERHPVRRVPRAHGTGHADPLRFMNHTGAPAWKPNLITPYSSRTPDRPTCSWRTKVISRKLTRRWLAHSRVALSQSSVR